MLYIYIYQLAIYVLSWFMSMSMSKSANSRSTGSPTAWDHRLGVSWKWPKAATGSLYGLSDGSHRAITDRAITALSLPLSHLRTSNLFDAPTKILLTYYHYLYFTYISLTSSSPHSDHYEKPLFRGFARFESCAVPGGTASLQSFESCGFGGHGWPWDLLCETID